jgi:hypothetical protein
MRWLQYWYLQICVDSLLKHRYHSSISLRWWQYSSMVLLFLGEWLIWSRWNILTVSFVEGKGPGGYWIQILGHDLFHHNRRQPLGFNQVVSSVVKTSSSCFNTPVLRGLLFSLTASAKCRGPNLDTIIGALDRKENHFLTDLYSSVSVWTTMISWFVFHHFLCLPIFGRKLVLLYPSTRNGLVYIHYNFS